MKNRLIVIYGIVVSLVYTFAVGFFSFNIISEYKNGYERTQITFDTMAHNVKAAVQKANPQSFDTDIANSIGSLHDYMSVEIKFNGQLYFNYPDHEVSGGKMTRSLFHSEKVDDTNIYINASLYLLRPYTIFSYARISFLIILVTTLITIILIIYFNFVEKQITGNSISYDDSETDDEDDDEVEYYQTTDAIDETSQIQEMQNSESSENKAIENDSEENLSQADISECKNDGKENNDDKNIQNEDSEKNDSEELETLDEVTKTDEKTETLENVKKQEAQLPSEEVKPMHIEALDEEKPAGLFSPITGFGWPQYFHTRLENELRRSTASEIDLALFLIKIPRMDKHDETILSICKYLSEQFQFADLIFEYNEDTFAAIKIAMTLDEALTFADKLHEEIEKQLSLLDLHCFMGISTRTVRLITADRIIKEAEEALVHAQAEKDSPIIAFRANVAKYKEFVEKN